MGALLGYFCYLGLEKVPKRFAFWMIAWVHGASAVWHPFVLKAVGHCVPKLSLFCGGYVLNGSKTFITNGQHCDVVVLATVTDPDAGSRGMSLFTVDTSLPGFARGRNLEKLGQHCSDTSELFMDDVRVGADQILGGEGRGFINLMNELPRERLILAPPSGTDPGAVSR